MHDCPGTVSDTSPVVRADQNVGRWLAGGPGSGIRTRGRLAPPPEYQSGALGRSSHASVARCAVGAVHWSANEMPLLTQWIHNYARQADKRAQRGRT